MSRRPEKPAPEIINRPVKRPSDQRRKLPPELEAFARSDEEKLRIRRPRTDRGTVHDPREGYTVAGVSNRDARAVYDVRTRAMQALWDGGQADERALGSLGQLLLDALRLELWHARRLTSFAAYAEEVLGIASARAEALAEAASTRTGEAATPLTERAIALWMRTEAGLYEGDESARARVRTAEGGQVLEISVALSEASTALAGVGARHLPLAREPRLANEVRDEPRAARAPRPIEDEDELGLEEDVDARQDVDASLPAIEPEHDLPEEGSAEDAEDKPAGGARLLTRKPAPDAAEGEPWTERPSRDDDYRGARRNGERSGNREGHDRDERPRFDQRDERPKFGQRDERPRFGQRDERPRFGQRDERPRFGQRDERPRFGQRDERPRFGQRDERPRADQDRPRFEPRADRSGGRGPVDRSVRPGQNKFGGQGKFGGGSKFGGKPGGNKFGGPKVGGGKFAGKGPAKGGFGARKQLDRPPERARTPREDDSDN